MPDSWKLGLRRAKDRFNFVLCCHPPPSPPSASASRLPQTTASQTSLSAHISTSVPLSMTPNHLPSMSAPISTSQTSTTQVPPTTIPATSTIPFQTPKPLYNGYTVIGGLPITLPSVPTHSQRTKEVGSTAYAGLTEIVRGLYDCSDMFLPLKAATGVFLTISKVVDRVSANRTELEELETKLNAILSIVQKYKEHDGIPAIKHRIETFCGAIVLQMEAVQDLHSHPVWARIAEATKDADKIAKVFRTMSVLCDTFQIDTQLNVNATVEDILQRLKSGAIEKLNHESTSYKTRHSSYGDPSGCMEGTRVDILANLEVWASSDESTNVYWMVGMAGTGKSTISHSFCEILDGKNMLAASFFCSRASEKTNNARFIVPTIAYELANSSPIIKSEIVMAIDNDKKLAEENYLNLEEQFQKLVYHPIRTSIGQPVRTYKVVVIDAVDECTDLQLTSSLIRLILKLVPSIPLKIFIASRDETLIREAFRSRSDIRKDFYLHNVEKDVVKNDIHKYLETSLANIKEYKIYHTSEEWPSQYELSALLDRSGTLFIYAATVVRYITDGGDLYKSRLSEMANRGLESVNEFETDIDGLYAHVLNKACERKRTHEISRMRDLVSFIVFLRNPLPVQAIESISQIDAGQLSAYLSPLTSVIHVPVDKESTIAPFHASFPDFLTDPTRCFPERCPRFEALNAPDGHSTLALRCLEHMNSFLKYNICDVPHAMTMSRRGLCNSLDNVRKISEALKYSCLHWASHLVEVLVFNTELITALHVFLHEHLLRWIECVSILGELQIGLKSLESASATLSHFKTADIRWNAIQLLVEDARRCVQMNFESIQTNCFEIYRSALVWAPKKSSIRSVYAQDVSRVPKVTLGLSNWWGPIELVMQNGSSVHSVAFSPNGTQVASGLNNGTLRIWNATTGEIEAELKGHTRWVSSVAFSQDGSRVVSGSEDKTARIWNATTGEVEVKLEGHTSFVTSVAFSQDGNRVASGSDRDDETVRIWNATTGGVEVELKGHTAWVTSVAFSQDGRRVVSGSGDGIILIWNATTGEVEAKLNGHTSSVTSAAFSLDGSRVFSGSSNGTVLIQYNAITGEIEMELKGHPSWMTSVAFSQDSSRVVSGSNDKLVRIWNATTGEVEARLEGHISLVTSVAFSQDGRRVVSGSHDETVRVWNTTTGQVETDLKGHTSWVTSVAFSQDGNRAVSGSHDKTARVWNTMTGEVVADLEGHMSAVTSVAFSQDGSRVISGSQDETVRIWNATTGKVEVKLEGHTSVVTSVAFSHGGSQVVSASDDETVRIWNATTGDVEAELRSHPWVKSIAFSQDDSQVLSESYDGTVWIWNVTRRESQSADTPFTASLNSSGVHHGCLEEFHVNYPVPKHPPPNIHPSLISDDGWILGAPHDCWIPPHDRNFISTSFSGGRICLGYWSGRVVILDMTIAL